MVSVEQIANGLLIYARDNLIGQIPKDNFKYIAGNVALEILGYKMNQNKDALLKMLTDKLSDSPLASFVDVITPDGMVDLELLKTVIPKYIQPEGFKINVPHIGVFTILPNDIDVVYNCILSVPAGNRSNTGGGLV